MATPTPRKISDQRGSALVAAMFILALVTLMGVALCFVGNTEMRMSQSGVRVKTVYFLAEAGVEHARTELYNIDTDLDFVDDLTALSTDGTLDFDPSTVQVGWDSNGHPTVSGYGDDQPITPLTQLGDGWYVAFVNNDPGEDISTVNDGNQRVMVTGIGIGPDRTVEIAQAIVERWELLPSLPNATITILGDNPTFLGGNSAAHSFTGNDCGVTGGLSVPIVGAIGSLAEAQTEDGIIGDDAGEGTGPDYDSGSWQFTDTFADLTDAANEPTLANNIDPAWLQCQNVKDMVISMRSFADLLCTDGTNCTLPNTLDSLTVVDDDFEVPSSGGAGTLVVTGTLNFSGQADWDGMIFAFGEGNFIQNGAGNGTISGAVVVANLSGPDGIFETADDCTGGTGGFSPGTFDLSGGGNADTEFCQANVNASEPNPPLRLVSYRQR